jgi:hypothetical protein
MMSRGVAEDVQQGELAGEGEVGVGDDVVYAEASDLVFKHTSWNAGDGPCRILEVISPAGLEHYVDELAAGVGSPEDDQARYGTQVDLGRTRRLCERYGLVFPVSA